MHALRFPAALFLTSLAATPALGQVDDAALPYTGRLEHDGQPADGDFGLTVTYFAAADDTAPCGEEVGIPVSVAGGTFSTLLVPPLICLTGPRLYLEMAVRPAGSPDYLELDGRQVVVPALKARAADPDAPFAVPRGLEVGPINNPARLEGVTGLTGLGVTTTGLRIAGPSNQHVVVDVLANGAEDAFVVRVPAAPAQGAPATELAFRVQGSGDTVVESLDARSIRGLVGGGDAPGCMPLGEVQICWGHYTSSLTASTLVTFAQPFADAAYALTCTPNGSPTEDVPRFCSPSNLGATGFRARTYSPDGNSAIGGSYIAIGRR